MDCLTDEDTKVLGKLIELYENIDMIKQNKLQIHEVRNFVIEYNKEMVDNYSVYEGLIDKINKSDLHIEIKKMMNEMAKYINTNTARKPVLSFLHHS